jgi:3-oxoadipate enol-lactonase
LIVFGEEDILIPFRYSKELNEEIKGSKLVVMKECGHASPLEKPDEFNALVMDFLKDYDSLLQTAV